MPVAEGRPTWRSWLEILNENDCFMEDGVSSLMVVATLVAGFTLQAGLNPPGGMVTDTAKNKGKSILTVVNRGAYDQYFTVQTIAILTSIAAAACMVGGISINRRVFVLLLRLITWVSFMATLVLNAISVSSFTPIDIHGPDPIILRLRNSLFFFAGLMWLVLVGHIIRLIVKCLDCRREGADGEAAAAA